ncbi:MAG: helix-hairpin-helix domain-containing protein, partial [Alistipes sp.]|nr:helix-hairpin-helix domain-containing protein [Alistipes sp.]
MAGRLFSDREIRGIALFVPLAALVVLAFALARPKGDAEAARRAETETARAETPAAEAPADSLRMRPFDPNTVDYDTLLQLGLTPRQAVSLLKFRASGKVFRIAEDVALCYGIDGELFRRLRPWIRIGRRYAIAPPAYRQGRILDERRTVDPAPFRIDTVSARYLRAIGALSDRQARAFVRWRDRSGIYDMEELRACYVVSDSVARALEPYVLFPERPAPRGDGTPAVRRVELNTADSAALRSVAGIGARTVGAILRYRERLGGFHRAEQLAEIPGVTERNYERILQQICCDSFVIRKIDVNFATPNELAAHPYMAPRTLRRLLKHR